MAAYIRRGVPVIFSAIVNENAGIGGGEFVTLDPATNKVTKNASTWDGDTYITVHVNHVGMGGLGDDKNAIRAKGELITMTHPLPGDEITITGITGDVGDTVRDNFYITEKTMFNGEAAVVLRCFAPAAEEESAEDGGAEEGGAEGGGGEGGGVSA